MSENKYERLLLDCKEPVEAYIRGKRKKDEEGINPFKLVSDFYYRETFHTDILLELLKPDGSHKEGNRFLDLFIEALNNTKKMVDSDKKINLEDYVDAKVTTKEYGTQESKMDIVIVSKDEKHCIIIENKLNNARDMERQIPRYYDVMHNNSKEVDGIVYIPLDETKQPDKSKWFDEDKKNVNHLIGILPARLLIDKWLTKCFKEATHDNSKYTIQFYIELLESLIMDDKLARGLYEVLCQGDNARTLNGLMEILRNGLPSYMARLIQAEFPNDNDYFPFLKISNENGCCKFEKCTLNGSLLKLDVVCTYEGFRLDLYDNNGTTSTKKILQEDSAKIENLARNYSCKFKIVNEKNKYTFYRFVFPITEFGKVIEFIKKILNILKDAQKNDNKLNEE